MQGQLWEGVLPGVLRSRYVRRETGMLTFHRGEERGSVRKGNIVSADTNVPRAACCVEADSSLTASSFS